MIFLYTNEGRIAASTEDSVEKVQATANDQNLNIYEVALDEYIAVLPMNSLYIDMRDNKLKQMPPAPTPAHTWDYKQRVWRTKFEDLQDWKWEEIKRDITAEEEAGFEFEGDIYDSDKESQGRINNAAVASDIDPTTSFQWTLKNNQVKELNAGKMRQLTKTMNEHIQGKRNKRNSKREDIYSARTEQAVIDIEA
jgi:hypothetical protein